MVDLQTQYLRIKPEIDEAIQHVLNTTAFIQGKDVSVFADALSTFLGGTPVVPCANGTDALQIALMALNAKPGDEVILPVHTYVATAEVLALLGLKPVFVEVDDNTFNVDVKALEAKVTAKTFAIVPVHLYGQCADMEPILALAAKHKLHVIEDAAQALGAVYTFADGTKRKAGTMGTIGTTSFFPTKNLGCFGDGGAIFTNDKALAEKIKMIASHGQKVKYHHEIVGVNSRLDTLQAAILNVKLKYLPEYEASRKDVAKYYDEHLAGISQLKLPARTQNSTHVFHQYTVQVVKGDRDHFKHYLEEKGIPTMIYYPVPLHLQNAYRQPGIGEGAFPITERLSRTVISLPIHTELPTEQLAYITSTIKAYFAA
ncbi:DegT/DnrJ/EryC1/StrS family aminotransferase [Chryseolinea sp. Jin1]|uniref:DegT/DnrJ/EryC1/StrS family aminotransferase n=2 Tax=Chryseolinea lacunae TaxID=2801331 RepID=A0ABS1KS67_9BACT|nr:DegT/DnrJ/EryC1/StrS family aminotransferase [Chryseolinea lacunae]MBL0742204.1 DegT/DnrJ/EryC1/StrS family aminotransferase [Chryseolinea lacunae]